MPYRWNTVVSTVINTVGFIYSEACLVVGIQLIIIISISIVFSNAINFVFVLYLQVTGLFIGRSFHFVSKSVVWVTY